MHRDVYDWREGTIGEEPDSWEEHCIKLSLVFVLHDRPDLPCVRLKASRTTRATISLLQ